MGRSTEKETRLSEQRKQLSELDGAAEAGDRAGRVARRSAGAGGLREHGISETLYYTWREKLFEGGLAALAGKEERGDLKELRRRIRELERTLGRKTYELEIAGEALRGWE
jgi:transposase-like protein